jgi:TPP-dependent pyruvate/acetoin dehydrogenase alpha subunit
MTWSNETQPPRGEQSSSRALDSQIALLRSMMRIRAFERMLMSMKQPGFQLLSSGEEAVAVGVCAALEPADQLLSSGRSIGPALARGLAPAAVMAEILGKAGGPCQGKGGRGHIGQPSAGFFGAHAVVAGNLTVAAGVALALQMQGRGDIVACIFGDGACGAGALHETLNIAALWKLPLLLVCNNNRYSISTPVAQALATKQLADLAQPFEIPARTVDGMDVLLVRETAREMIDRARKGEGPSFLECLSCRFATHSTATRESRSEEELRSDRARCPIRALAGQLLAAGLLDEVRLAHLQRDVDAEAEEAGRQAVQAPWPDLAQGCDDD